MIEIILIGLVVILGVIGWTLADIRERIKEIEKSQ